MSSSQLSERDDRFAQALRGFGPLGILVFLIILLIGPAWFRGILVLVWAVRSGTPFRAIGFVRPQSWLRTISAGIIGGCVLKLFLKSVVMPLLGAPPINYAYHYLAHNPAALPGILFTVIISAGFGEETVFRGYLFERLRRLLRDGRSATVAVLLISSVLFALGHYFDQGIPGIEQALITGLVFGTMYAVTQQIWLPMITHAAFDLTAVAIIYWELESQIAHWLFK